MKYHTIKELCEIAGIDENGIRAFVEREWICPIESSSFDEEDVARVRLIVELEHDFGANEEAIPIILHLVDQLHHLRNRLQEYSRPPAE